MEINECQSKHRLPPLPMPHKYQSYLTPLCVTNKWAMQICEEQHMLRRSSGFEWGVTEGSGGYLLLSTGSMSMIPMIIRS